MSFEDAKQTLQALAGKNTGDLIRASDWNALIAGIVGLGDSLNDSLTAVTARVNTLEATVTQLDQRVTILENKDVVLRPEFDAHVAQVQPLLDQYRITLQTTKADHAVGELATITAKVTTLDGAVPAGLPWVDFVCSWGTLSAEAGFTARPGTGGNSISIRVNSQGIARARVAAQHTERMTVVEQEQFAQFVSTNVTSENQTFPVAQWMTRSNTPEDTPLRGVFKQVSKAHDEPGQAALRLIADDYMGAATLWRDTLVRPGEWRDYRSTVFASVTADGDPTTPDQSRGLASIQIRFRDWLGPWIDRYPDDLVFQAPPFVDVLRLPDHVQVTKGLVDEVRGLLRGKNRLEQMKIFPALDDILGGVTPPSPEPEFFKGIVQDARMALVAERTARGILPTNGAQSDSVGALAAFVSQSSKTQTTVSETKRVGSEVQQASQKAQASTDQVAGIKQDLGSLNKRMGDTETRSLGLDSKLQVISEKVVKLPELDQTQVRTGLLEINARLAEALQLNRR